MAVVTKSLARGSKQCEQSDGKSIQQPKPIPSFRRVDAYRSHPHAKAQVLRIAKPRLNSPAFSIGRHQFFGGIRCRACGQTPGFFHILGVDTDNGAYLIAISRNKSVAQGSRTSAHSNPVRCRACLTFGRGHGDIAAEPYGALRGVAVGGSKRSAMLPELPTIGDTVTGYEATSWFGLLAPTKTPRAIVDKVNAA